MIHHLKTNKLLKQTIAMSIAPIRENRHNKIYLSRTYTFKDIERMVSVSNTWD